MMTTRAWSLMRAMRALAVKSHEIVPDCKAVDRRATVETGVGTMLVVVVQPPRQRGSASSRRAVGPDVRPFREQRANEALGFAVGAGRVGTDSDVPQLLQRAHARKGVA